MPVNSPVKLARAAFATSSATLYTTPASTTTIVTSIVICNSAASAGTYTLVLDSVDLAKDVAIAANTSQILDVKQVLNATQLITGLASAVTISYHISGVESV